MFAHFVYKHGFGSRTAPLYNKHFRSLLKLACRKNKLLVVTFLQAFANVAANKISLVTNLLRGA